MRSTPRRLREFDPERTVRLANPLQVGSGEAFADGAEEELFRAGSRAQDGFER
ncbi:MAG: hypothetical protein ACTHZX_01420 [Microbacterium sp.]